MEESSTSPDSNECSMRDVAIAALYGNIPLNLPGYDRPEQEEMATNTASSKFHQYLSKYRPTGWSHYDVNDLSQDMEKLFKADYRDTNADESDDEDAFRQQQERIDSVRRKLNFDFD